MTNTAAPAPTAAAILAAFEVAKAERIEIALADVAFGEWADPQRGRDYVALLRSAAAWQVDDRTVVATVTDNRDGSIWGYSACSLLDAAASGFAFDPEVAMIHEDSPVRFRFTF